MKASSPTIIRTGPDDAVDVDVQVVPRASRSRIVGVHGDRLKIQLAAPPVDGAANKSLIELIAKVVGLSRRQVSIIRGQTGKRKTLRLLGTSVDKVRQALGLDSGGSPKNHGVRRHRRRVPALLGRTQALEICAFMILAGGCEAPQGPHLRLVLPEGDVSIEGIDNASLVLDPGGPSVTYDIDGPDFTLELELEEDDIQRSASLYLARGSELVAWGRSAPFVLADLSDELAIFVGRPGALSTFPGEVTGTLGMVAARAIGRGLLFVADDGGTYLLSERNLEISAGKKFPAPTPEAATSLIVGERSGGVIRLSWTDGLIAWRFDPGADSWRSIDFTGDLDLGPREGATWLQDGSAEHLLLFGGGESNDILEISLQPTDEDTRYQVRRSDTLLDGPRPRATPTWVTREGTDEGEGVLLFGGDQDDLALVYFTGRAPVGDARRWTGASCVQVERGADANANVTLRVLCFGGLQDGAPTRDAVLVQVPAEGPLSVDLLPEWLPADFTDAKIFADESALYAQAGASWLRIDRRDLSAELQPTAAQRTNGGHSINLGTGVTFLVGGVTAEGQAVDRWQVFTPT
ncbi:MAG TPA: DUF167 domain-containing protein, partial [Nannocystis exedens]|nr:DUF167 domain-containing protein [Nannocystis exedens]